MLLAGGLSACDRENAAGFIRELDAAREGCTEEMLAAGAEECVRMFERYIDLGAEGLERYIGAVRAFDEAIQRRSGISFDTAGLGQAITAPPPGRQERSLGPMWAPEQGSRGAADWKLGPSGAGEWNPGHSQHRQVEDGYPGAPETPMDNGVSGRANSSPYLDTVSRNPEQRPPTTRGVLLPPNQRLRRPWLDGEALPDDYYDGVP